MLPSGAGALRVTAKADVPGTPFAEWTLYFAEREL